MPDRCDECIHWNFSYVDGVDKFGKCNNSLVLDDVRIVREDDVEDLFTNANFGCVWFEEENKVVTKI